MSILPSAHATRNRFALPLGLVAVLTLQLLSAVALQPVAAPAAAQATTTSAGFGQAGAPSWDVFHGPAGSQAFEPSVGDNWNTGNAMYIAEGTSTFFTVYRISFTDGATGATANWADSGASLPIQHFPGGVVSLHDPILYTDPVSGRTYAGDIQGTCTEVQYTSDDGQSGWTNSNDACSFTGADHETIGSGPWSPDPATGSNPPPEASYPRAVYDCAQTQTMQCGISYDGGATFVPTGQPDPTHACGGLHGHIRVSPDGTANVPNKNCNGGVGVVSTHDNGLTWSVATVPGSTNSASFDPSLAPTTGNWLYVGQAYNNGAFVGLTKDHGQGWEDVGTASGAAAGTKWFNVASLDPTIRNTEFAEMIAGDNERAAFAFLGQTAVGAGDPHTCSPTSSLEWYLYVAMTYDAGQSWSLQKVTTDPVQRNGISNGGTTGDQSCRNMADFNDITVDAEGRVLVAFTDGCPDPCTGPGSTGTAPGLVRQFSGRGLFAANDTTGNPTNPSITITTPSEGANVPAGALSVQGTVNRNAGQQTPPLVAHANGPYGALAGSAIALTGTHSGGDPAQAYTCAWSDDGGGTYDNATSCTAHVTFASAGDFQLTLTVHNGAASATDTAAASITAGHIHGSLFAYQTTPVALPPNPAVAQYPGVGVSNVLATVTALAGDPVPKFLGGTWVTVSVRSAASTDVSISPATPVQFTIQDAHGAVVEGPFTAHGGIDSSGGFQYSYAPIVIPCASGRYDLVAVATVGSSAITISNDGSPDGKAPFDVIAAPLSLPQCPTGASAGALNPALPTHPLSASTGPLAADYYFHGTNPIGNGDTFPMPMTTVAPTASNPKVVYPAPLDGTNRPNFIYDAADWETTSAITLDHQDLKATWWIAPGPKSSIESALVPSTWEIVLFKDGVAFKTIDPAIAGPTAPMVGPTELSYSIPDVSMASGKLGILIDPHYSDTVDSPILYDAVAYASRLHIAAPTGPQALAVDAGGPYSGAVGSAIAIAATATGGTAPVSCAWTGAGATFANASACSTTVSYAAAGSNTISVTATDSASPTPATATGTATVSVTSSSVERVELYLDGAASGPSIPVSTSDASPTASWSGTVSLTGLSGFHTITAKWFDAGVESTGTPLATASVNVTVQQATGTPFVEITNPSSDGQTRDPPTTFNGTYSTDGHSPSATASSHAFDPGLAQLLHGVPFGTATLSLRNLPGFVAAIPVPGTSTPTLAVGLSGDVPADAPASVPGWQVHYTPNVKEDPLAGHTDHAVKALSIDQALAQFRSAQSAPAGPYLPGPNAADGIGPGSAIVFPIGGGSSGLCSASFLLRDPSTLKYYLATAGHCLLKGEAGPATSGYDTPAAVWPEIDVCFKGCIENWNAFLGSLGTYVAFHASADNSYNPVAFAQAQGVGQDIGLIEIPASAEPLLRPYLPEWGGPVDYQEPAQGDLLVHYGHGAYCCPTVGAVATRTPVDQGRIAISLGNDGSSFQALGDLSGGDSGSATATLKPRLDKLLLGDGAVGVNTHGTLVDHFPLFAGTLLKHGVAMAAAKGYGNLDLVNEDGTLVSLGGASTAPTPQAAFTSPAAGSSVAQGTSVALTGTATFPPPDARLAYYLHRDACGTTTDNPHMDTTPSDVAEGGDGCGDSLGAIGLLSELIPFTSLPVVGDIGGEVATDFPAIPAPGHAIALNASKPVEVQVFFAGFVGEPTQVYHDLEGRLYSGVGATRTLVASGRVATVLPPTGQVGFNLQITGPSTLPANAPLLFELVEHESLGPMFIQYGGSHPSQIRLPLATAPANSVQVSVDDPAFAAANQLAVTGTTSWSATWNVSLATATGPHTLYARALQGTSVQSPPAALALTVTAAAAPHAAFTWNAQELAVQFNDTSTPGAAPITSWAWNFGDGGTSTAQNPTHTYSGDGTYTVTLTATDSNGSHGSVSHSVTVAHVVLWNVQVRILDGQGHEAVGWTTVVANAHTGDAGLWSYTWSPATTPAAGDYTLVATLLKDGSAVATANRTFVVPNHAPTLAVPGPQTVAEGSPLDFNVSASDPDGDTVTYSASGLPAGATLDSATGAFHWTPGYDQAGSYVVTFTASDGRGGTANGTVAITVTNTDRAPVLDHIADVTAKARTPIQFTVHANDPDGDAVAYSATGLPVGATLNPATGAFSWTPTRTQVGTYTVTFHASDGTLESLQDVHFTITKK